jgi:hypothetical protein
VIDTVLPARDGEAVVRVALLFAAAMVVDFCCDAG